MSKGLFPHSRLPYLLRGRHCGRRFRAAKRPKASQDTLQSRWHGPKLQSLCPEMGRYQWVSHHIHSCSRSPKGVQRHSKDILADEFPEGHTLLIMLSQAYTYTIYTSLDMVYSKPGFSAIERWHPRRQFVERATQAPNIRAWPSPPNSWAQRKMPSCFTFNRFRRYGQKQQHFHAVKWPKE